MKKGFSLPLWVAGAARSALKKLVGLPFENYEQIKIPNEQKEIKIEIHSVGLLKHDSQALGISFAKSGLDLDITQNLEIWTIASLEKISFNNPVQTIPNDLLLVLSAKNAPFGKIISNFKLKPAGIISNKFSYKTSLAKSEMLISDVFSFIPTPDPAIKFIEFV